MRRRDMSPARVAAAAKQRRKSTPTPRTAHQRQKTDVPGRLAKIADDYGSRFHHPYKLAKSVPWVSGETLRTWR
jgi:hypothetical protein